MEISRGSGLAPSVVSRILTTLTEGGHLDVNETNREKFYFTRYTPWEREFMILAGDAQGGALLAHVAARPRQDNRAEVTEALGLATKSMTQFSEGFIALGVLDRMPLATGRPGVGYAVLWPRLGPALGLLLCKLPGGSALAGRLAPIHVLYLQAPKPKE